MQIQMHNPFNGKTREAYTGASLSVMFFGPMVPFIRGDFRGMLVMWFTMLCGMLAFGIGYIPVWIYWIAKYNKGHYNRMVRDGFVPVEGE